MPLKDSLRPILPLTIGLLVGAAGVKLFSESLTGEINSPERRIAELEVKLRHAVNRANEYAATGGRRTGRTTRDRLRELVEDFRGGRPVSPDDLFRATQPFLRDIAPLFERIRLRQQEQETTLRVGQYTREYNLNPAQQAALKSFFQQNATEKDLQFENLLLQDGTRIQEVMKFTSDSRSDDGLDAFMAATLRGDMLVRFQSGRMAERARNVQQEADAKVERLHNIVTLDNAQRDTVFAIAARNSKDYDPAMAIEGGTTTDPAPDRDQSILSVLRPDQQRAFSAERERRREDTRKEMEAYGLMLPPDWDVLDPGDF